MAKTKSQKLQQKVNSDKVRYALACGRLVIQPKGSQLIEVGGRWERMELPGISLTSEGERRSDGVTREYDPTNPKDAKIIETVDQFMEDNPEVVNLITVQLRKMTGPSLGAPLPRWDEMDAESIVKGIMATSHDPEHCYRYELQRNDRFDRNGQKLEPREEVLDALERLNDDLENTRKDAPEAKVKL
jgi:hypothetical protein